MGVCIISFPFRLDQEGQTGSALTNEVRLNHPIWGLLIPVHISHGSLYTNSSFAW